MVKKTTKQEALREYRENQYNDPFFAMQYKDDNDDFYEWCSLYDDLKHIKKRGNDES